MRFLDLFAGIGGFSLGLERAGMKCVGQVEIDPYCQKVLKKHWPDVKRMSDIREVKGDEFGTVELICGGFPCQPFSQSGERCGQEDDRYLWPEMLRVIQANRPHWVLGENVNGIIDMALDEVLANLENQGYASQAIIIPACSIGAQHIRGRVWILANSKCGGLQVNIPEFDYFREGFSISSPLANGCDEELVQEDGLSWPPQSRIRRVANGFPNWMDRIKALGNAVVPQIPEIIGRYILKTERIFKDMEADLQYTTDKGCHS